MKTHNLESPGQSSVRQFGPSDFGLLLAALARERSGSAFGLRPPGY
jgi:hypothetical protein